MRVSCTSCGSKYTIADDKVRGRRVKVRCKTCGTPIVVDGTKPEEVEPSGHQAQPFGAAPFEKAALAEPPSPFAAQSGEPSGDAWSVNLSDSDQRDMTTEEITAAWKAGTLTDDAYVWKDGMGDWVPILDQPELRALLQGVSRPVDASDEVVTSAPAPKAAAPAAATARVASGRGAAVPDLFSSVARAGSEEDAVATSAPASTAYDAASKATGARNENSVLFSLDSLKTAMGAPAVAPGAPSAKRAPSAPKKKAAPLPADDPFGLGGGVAGFGGGSAAALFTPDAQALLTAPAPEPPPRRILDEPLISGFSGAAPRRSKSRLYMAVGGAGAVVALLVVGIVVATSGGEDKEVPKAETAAEDSSSKPGSQTASDEKPSEETKATEEKPAESAKAEEKPAPEPAKEEDEPEASKEATKSITSPRSTTKTAAPTSKSEPNTQVTKTPSSGVSTFNKGAAVAALSTAAAQASSCKRPGGPTGRGKALVTFASSGRVTSATVTGAGFAGTSVGGCVASVFRRASVPSFSGSPVTVSKSFTISP